DDFYELGSASRFSSLNLTDSFARNPILTHPKLSSDSVQFIYDFYTLLKTLSSSKKPKEILDIIENSRFFDSITSLLSKQRAKRKDGTIDETQEIDAKVRIKRKVALLKNLSLHYDDIYRFLNAMVLGSREMSEGEGVNLLTVHASKGLEFKEVYVVDLMEGRFPNSKLIQKGGSLEEERRLFYVASTRAKDRLFLSYAKYDPIRKTDFVASTFLYEAGLLKK
ncbi:MAG: 3'-5' exonuclease, partial [Campylobacterales bacterium]